MTVLDSRPAPISSTLGRPVVDTGIIDVDVHPAPKPGVIEAYLPARWREHMRSYGTRSTTGVMGNWEYPTMYGYGQRADAWGPNGEYPGTELGMIRTQLLDRHDVQLGVLECFSINTAQAVNHDQAAALCRAGNDWQLEQLVYPEPRLRLAMLVPYEAPDLAVDEIRRLGSDPGVVSVLFASKTLQPFGERKYWPIYEAAIEAGLPIQVHLSQGGGNPNTGTGWSSYHPEYHTAHPQVFQHQLLSLILSGTFDRFPELRFLFVESNLLHLVPLLKRLEYHWSTLGGELPDLQRRPSEYVPDHLWVATQPLDEPDDPRHLVEMIGEFGSDNVVFATDYPHFDFDDPDTAFPGAVPTELREKILRTNGKALFRLQDQHG